MTSIAGDWEMVTDKVDSKLKEKGCWYLTIHYNICEFGTVFSLSCCPYQFPILIFGSADSSKPNVNLWLGPGGLPKPLLHIYLWRIHRYMAYVPQMTNEYVLLQCPVPVKVTLAELPGVWLMAAMIPKGNMIQCMLRYSLQSSCDMTNQKNM